MKLSAKREYVNLLIVSNRFIPSILALFNFVFFFVFSDIQVLLHLREIMWYSLNFFIRYYDSCSPEAEPIRQFKIELRSALSKLLKDSDLP